MSAGRPGALEFPDMAESSNRLALIVVIAPIVAILAAVLLLYFTTSS